MLFKTTFLENWGSGAGRMMDVCHKQNVAEPEWKAQGGFVIVTFKRPKQNSSIPQVRNKYGTSGKQVGNKYEPSKHQVKELIKAMTEDFMSMQIMMSKCEMKSRMRFLYDYVIPALDDGAIERKYPDLPRHPKQQYRLTDKAIEWKHRNNEE